jgi:hypothetical protein
VLKKLDVKRLSREGVSIKSNNMGTIPPVRVPLLQNMFVVSAGKVSLVSALHTDTIYTIRKRRSF